jgi:hypothetical protein
MPRHTHKFTIADNDAVQELLSKLHSQGSRGNRRERLFDALEQASQRYNKSSQKERQAFFHGLLTGYAVALKLW